MESLKVSITSEKEVTVDFIVAEATAIWREMRAFSGSIEEGSQKSREKHPEFCKSYPIVHRYICEMKLYDAKVFRRWLLAIKERPWKTEDAYIEAQADYVTRLYAMQNPRAKKATITEFRSATYKTLLREHEDFKKTVADVYEEVTANEKQRAAKNLSELYDYIRANSISGADLEGLLRVETDLCAENLPNAADLDVCASSGAADLLKGL